MSLTEPKTSTEQAQLSREEVHEILKRHKGSISRIAEELGITVTTVSQWLLGRTVSQRIETAARKRATEFLKREAA